MKPFAPYVATLESLLTRATGELASAAFNDQVAAALDGQPSAELRRVVDLQARRAGGAFFTGAVLAKRVLRPIFSTLNARSVIYDPACGAGDLLVACARHLSVGPDWAKTVALWGGRVFGRELHPEFVQTAKLRLALAAWEAQPRGARCQPSPTSVFPGITTGCGLAEVEMIQAATHVVLNPPYAKMDAPQDCAWGGGKVSAAACFLDHCVRNARAGTRIVAILPDVLRSGERYCRWRERIAQRSCVESIRLLGQFDRWADVDVFALQLRVAKRNAEKHTGWSYPRAISATSVGDYFTVSVGPVVPYRDPRRGPRLRYIHSRIVPPWGTHAEASEFRRFAGTTHQPPFVVVRRTSRREDRERARPSNVAPGTVVEIENLRVPLDTGQAKRLARALVLLADPFSDADAPQQSPSFRPVLRAPEFEELEQLVARRYFDEADFHLHAELDIGGKASAWIRDYQGEEVFRGLHRDLCSREQTAYGAPPAIFDFWTFLLGGKRDSRFSPRAVTLTEIKDWLRAFGGVHLYHRGMRVSPYSDLDWLEMNLRRSQFQELRPSTNTSIGRVVVRDVEGRLRPKTDRVGFIEDETFQELRRFATDALEWLADCRMTQRESHRESTKAKTARRVRLAKKDLAQAMDAVPAPARQGVARAVEGFEKAKERETHVLREDLQLYRTLCTVGATTAAFAHQAKSPLAQITSSAGTLEDALRRRIDANQLPTLREMAVDIRRFAESLLAFSKVTLSLLQHEKRRRATVSLHEAVVEVVTLMKPYLQLRQVTVRRELAAERCSVLASQAALESILTNLLINSLQAFERNRPGERLVEFRTANLRDPRRPGRSLVRLIVSDNGPGIEKLSVDDVWLPGKTTTLEGTGLGLTIVKDVVTELGGNVGAAAHGELGGAEFQIDLPARGG